MAVNEPVLWLVEDPDTTLRTDVNINIVFEKSACDWEVEVPIDDTVWVQQTTPCN